MRQSKSLGIAVVLGLLLRRRSVQANLTPFHDTPPPSTGLYILGESRPDVNTRGKFGRRGGSVVDKPVPPRNSNFLAYRDLRQVRRKDDCTGSRTFGEIDSALIGPGGNPRTPGSVGGTAWAKATSACSSPPQCDLARMGHTSTIRNPRTAGGPSCRSFLIFFRNWPCGEGDRPVLFHPLNSLGGLGLVVAHSAATGSGDFAGFPVSD